MQWIVRVCVFEILATVIKLVCGENAFEFFIPCIITQDSENYFEILIIIINVWTYPTKKSTSFIS